MSCPFWILKTPIHMLCICTEKSNQHIIQNIFFFRKKIIQFGMTWKWAIDDNFNLWANYTLNFICYSISVIKLTMWAKIFLFENTYTIKEIIYGGKKYHVLTVPTFLSFFCFLFKFDLSVKPWHYCLYIMSNVKMNLLAGKIKKP